MSDTFPPVVDAATHNLQYFELGYAAFWVIFFVYLVFLHVKLRRIGQGESK